MLTKLVKQKWVIWVLLLLPGAIFLFIPIIEGRAGAKLWSKELKYSGFIAVSLLFVSLILTPFVKIFSRSTFFKGLNRHRREIGLMLFFYVCFHFLAFFLKTYFKKGYFPLEKFLRPIVFTGFIAFLLMVPLALTSNNLSIRKLGWLRWKRLHHLIYMSEALVFIHMVLQGDNVQIWAFIFFVPLFIFQLVRLLTP